MKKKKKHKKNKEEKKIINKEEPELHKIKLELKDIERIAFLEYRVLIEKVRDQKLKTDAAVFDASISGETSTIQST